MVHHFGCSHEEVDEAARGIKKIRKQRARTKSLSPAVERRQEVVELIARKMRKTLLLGGGSGIGGFGNSNDVVYGCGNGYGNGDINGGNNGGVLLDKKNIISAYENAGDNLSNNHLVAVR